MADLDADDSVDQYSMCGRIVLIYTFFNTVSAAPLGSNQISEQG